MAEADPTEHSHGTGGTSTLCDPWCSSAVENCVAAGRQNSLTVFFPSLTFCTRCHQLGSEQSVASVTRDNGAEEKHMVPSNHGMRNIFGMVKEWADRKRIFLLMCHLADVCREQK